MRSIYFIVYLIFLILPCITAGQNKLDKIERIKADSSYKWGEGSGSSLEEADIEALQNLSRNISVSIGDSYLQTDSEVSTSKHSYSEEIIESQIRVASFSTLQNVEQIVTAENNRIKVFRFVRIAEVEKMFAARKDKALAMLDVAQKAENELKLDQAFKYYYWSYLLTRTLVHPNELTYTDNNGEERQVAVWIPVKIAEILQDIKFSFDGYPENDETIGRLKVMYRGNPVTSLDYTYWDGFSWSALTSANNGLGSIELRANSSVSSINVKIEYTYEHEAHIDNEISSIISSVNDLKLSHAYKNGISLKKVNRHENTVKTGFTLSQPASSFTSSSMDYSKTINKVFDGMESRQYEQIRNCFTDEGYDIFSRLIRYGNARILDRPQLKYLKIGDYTYCRCVPMRFSFNNNNRVFNENVVFVIDDKEKICSISFGLEETTVNDILNKSRWEDDKKAVLINFLENYKTAFALKRLDYISSIFSDDALIITGRVVKHTTVENQIQLAEHVEYSRYSKKEYLGKLKYSFASKEFINLKFANIDILKMGKGDNLFSIQIKQDYYSSNYGDSGYLFLLLDLNDTTSPIIHVRTWQPQPDPEFGVFGPGDLQ